MSTQFHSIKIWDSVIEINSQIKVFQDRKNIQFLKWWIKRSLKLYYKFVIPINEASCPFINNIAIKAIPLNKNISKIWMVLALFNSGCEKVQICSLIRLMASWRVNFNRITGMQFPVIRENLPVELLVSEARSAERTKWANGHTATRHSCSAQRRRNLWLSVQFPLFHYNFDLS